ncbi:MAG TPA: cyclic nucleotide-binding domain-containing protein [Thermoleophilaceae bacterium]|nr:cyclic nucleotide-binding domain-containing protein [Thermoleophilaceae bacterium]
MDEARLASIDLFSSLSKRERSEIASRADELEILEGTHLVREGEFAYEFFVIEDGEAEVLRGGEHVASLGPGDFLGEIGIVTRAPRNASVVARSPMRVLVMSEQDFRGIAQMFPSVAEQIREAVRERIEPLVA